MQKKGKGGKKNKGDQGNQKKQDSQAKAKEMMENPQAGLANLQNELMAKISAMKEGLLKGEGGEGLGKEVIDNLFKNLLGDMGMGGPRTVNRKEYEESEAGHQEFLAQVDDTLLSISASKLEIEGVYDKIIRGDLEDMEIIPEKENEYTLSAEDDAKYMKENKYVIANQGSMLTSKARGTGSRP